MPRTLVLKRTVLQELTAGELGGIVGADGSFSCLDFVSCQIPWCLRTVRECTEIVTVTG
jgi:hypothetical protein